MKNNNPFNVQVGQIWEVMDERRDPPRRVKILGVDKRYAQIITIGADYKARPHKARLDRFNGRSHNYRLAKRVSKNARGGK